MWAVCLGVWASVVAAAEHTDIAVIDAFEGVKAWTVNQDGGQKITFRADHETSHSPPASMRVRFEGNRWGNLRRSITIPPDATAVVLWARVHQTEPKAQMHVWLFEPDGDGWVAKAVHDGTHLADWPKEWIRVRVPIGRFRHDPRGDRKRNLLSVNRILLCLNSSPSEISVDDLAWEVRSGSALVPLRRSDSFKAIQGKLGRVAILDEPILCPDVLKDSAKHVERTLRQAGFGTRLLLAGDLADPKRLSRERADLLVLPQGPKFPLQARDTVLKFLESGGSLLTAGGYAFDDPAVRAEGGWVSAGTNVTAANVQSGRVPETRINTRFGKPGDTMRFHKKQIGLFDPSDELLHVAYAEFGGARIPGPLTGFVAGIVDPTGSPVYGTAHLQYHAIGQTFDRLGRKRGAPGGLAHHFAGPYAGSSWAFFGVDNVDLFAQGRLPDEVLTTTARRLIDQVYLHGLESDLACYRDGEPVRIRVRVANRGRSPRSARLRILIEGQSLLDQALEVKPDGGTSREFQVEWKPDRFAHDFYRLRAELDLGYHTDVVENAFCVWKEGVVRRGPKIDLVGNYLRVDGTPTLLTGTNQTGRMWLSEYENPLVWERDFAGMRDHGLKTWRILHFSPVMHRNDPLALAQEIPKKVFRQTDAIVQLAQKHGVAIFLTMHDWMPVELTDAQLAAQAKWNATWAKRYRNVPGMLYDVQNEPAVRITNAPHIVAAWKSWLTGRYGSMEAAASRWGVAPGHPSALKPQAEGKRWDDLKAVDVERFRVHMLNRWVRANVEPIRSADPDALTAVGFLQRLRPADKVLGVRHIDISNMHSYLPPRAFPSDFKIMDRRAVGKTLSIGEFGQREAHDARTVGRTGDLSEASIRRYMIYNHYVFGLGGSWTASWCWRDMPDCVFPWGMTWMDHRSKPVLRAYRNLTLMNRFVRPTYVAPRIWLVLPDAHRLGGQWTTIQGGIDRAIDALLGLGVEFGVLREHDVVAGVLHKQTDIGSESNPTAPILLWPMPYCPADPTFDAIRREVERGAMLYLSGDIAFDPARKPTRPERLAALGLKLDAHNSPTKTAPHGKAQTSSVGTGRVFFVPYPVELASADQVRAQYDAFLDWAEAPRIPLGPRHSDLHAMATRSDDGMIVYRFVNHGEPRQAVLQTGSGTVALSFDAPGWGLLGIDPKGYVRLLQASGSVTRDSHRVMQADADVTIIAMDEEDITKSGRILILPSFPGKTTIRMQHEWREPRLIVGDVIGGEFKTLSESPATIKDDTVRIAVDEVTALCLMLVTEGEQAESAKRQLVETLTLNAR